MDGVMWKVTVQERKICGAQCTVHCPIWYPTFRGLASSIDSNSSSALSLRKGFIMPIVQSAS